MAHPFDVQNSESHRHQAVDGLFHLFTKANHDLSSLRNKLEKEFKQTYPDNVNPMRLVARIKKIEEEVSFLNDQCRELLAAKQDLIDKARLILIGNRSLLQKLQVSTGLTPDDSSDAAYTNFNQIIEEWTVHVRSRTDDEKLESGSEDINHLLFSAIVPGS